MSTPFHPPCQKKQEKLSELFASCPTPQEKYQRLIALGRTLPPLAPQHQTEANLVPGCQSRVYLHATLNSDQLVFEAASDALISAGLAALLIAVYSGESPHTVLTCPPHFVERIQLTSVLTPSRSNGLFSMHLRMKQLALSALSCNFSISRGNGEQ